MAQRLQKQCGTTVSMTSCMECAERQVSSDSEKMNAIHMPQTSTHWYFSLLIPLKIEPILCIRWENLNERKGRECLWKQPGTLHVVCGIKKAICDDSVCSHCSAVCVDFPIQFQAWWSQVPVILSPQQSARRNAPMMWPAPSNRSVAKEAPASRRPAWIRWVGLWLISL